MMETSVCKGLILIRKAFLALALPFPSASSASADFFILSGSDGSVCRKLVPTVGVVFDFAGVSDLYFDVTVEVLEW